LNVWIRSGDQLRIYIADWMEQYIDIIENCTFYSDTVVPLDPLSVDRRDVSQLTLPQRIRQLKFGGEWGGDLELQVIATAFNINVILVSPTNVILLNGFPHFNQLADLPEVANHGTIVLLYNGTDHYEAVQPATGASIDHYNTYQRIELVTGPGLNFDQVTGRYIDQHQQHLQSAEEQNQVQPQHVDIHNQGDVEQQQQQQCQQLSTTQHSSVIPSNQSTIPIVDSIRHNKQIQHRVLTSNSYAALFDEEYYREDKMVTDEPPPKDPPKDPPDQPPDLPVVATSATATVQSAIVSVPETEFDLFDLNNLERQMFSEVYETTTTGNPPSPVSHQPTTCLTTLITLPDSTTHHRHSAKPRRYLI